MHDMFGFQKTQKKHSNKPHYMKERKVIRGIIHKKCPLCEEWVPETEFHYFIHGMDAKQSYCVKCKGLYQRWHKAVCKKYKVKRLKDIPGYVQPERGRDMHQFIVESLRNGGKINEINGI